MFCVSGAVKRPGTFEAPMKVTLKELIYDYAGGPLDGHHIKAVIPGGSSVPILMPDQIDIPASFDDVQKAGSLLGSAAIMVLDETTDMVWLAENLLHFYKTSHAEVRPPRRRRLALQDPRQDLARRRRMRDIDCCEQHQRQALYPFRRDRARDQHRHALPARVGLPSAGRPGARRLPSSRRWAH
jgi:NADH-quinone oxidoreductase subunit F